MSLQEELRRIGLTKNESLVYLFILENGLSSPPQIAQATKIQRTNCYHIIHQLINMGLIREEAIRSNRKGYIATDPESLYRSLEERRQTVESILPDLRALHASQRNKPQIRFYDGLEQIKEVYWGSTRTQEVFAFGSTKSLEMLMPDFFQKYIGELQKNNVVFHDILTHASKEDSGRIMQSVLGNLYDVEYLPTKYQDTPTDILIWDDNVALISLEKPHFATVLTNTLIALTLRNMVKLIREYLRS